MALVLADRVKVRSQTAGTGTITLADTALGFQSFEAVGSGNDTYYGIIDNVGNWEIGQGTYTKVLTVETLSRNTVISSSNNNNKVNFPVGGKNVFGTFPSSLAQTIAGTGSVGDLRSESNINIDINLSDSTLHRWQFGEDGILTLPPEGTISNSGNNWTFGSDGTLSYPRSALQRDTITVTCPGNASTVVYTAASAVQYTVKLLIQVEGFEGAAAATDSQACEMIIAKSFRADDIASSVYAVVHTSTAPLATFTAQWNALTSRIQVLCTTPSANAVYVRIFATEITQAP